MNVSLCSTAQVSIYRWLCANPARKHLINLRGIPKNISCVLSPALKPDDLHRKLTFRMSFIMNSQVPNTLKCKISTAIAQ